MRYSFVLNATGKAELMQIEGRYRQMVSRANFYACNKGIVICIKNIYLFIGSVLMKNF